MVAIGAADDGAREHESEPLLSLSSQKLQQSTHHTDYQAAAARAAGSEKTATTTTSTATSSSSSFSSTRLFIALQLVLVASVVVYTVAFTIFPSSFVQLVFMDRIGQWWSETTADGQRKVHFEMERPGFLFVFCVVPFAIGTIALEYMRGPQNLHRVVSHHVLRVGIVLRRKPSALSSSRLRLVQWLATFSYGEILFLALLVGGNAVQFIVSWLQIRQYHPVAGKTYTVYTTLEILGTVLGYNSVYNMAFLFLPTTRNSAWMEFLGISYANGMKFHRWLGIATLATAVGHALPFYPVWFHDGVLWEKAMPCFDCSLDYLSKGYPAWFNVFGEISLLFLMALGATSLPWIRRHAYELFYYAHYLFVPGVVFAVLHWGTIVWWLLPSFTIYLVDRVLGTTNALRSVPVLECSVLSDGILKLVVARSAQRAGDFEVGQFVYLNVPAIATWQWHAFTIGSSPRASATAFTVWLKSLGDWTEDLVQHANARATQGEQPVVFVDGYYGASLESYDQYATLCLVGGGIGVTPLFAMLEDILYRPQWHQNRKIHFVFSFRELALLEEIHPVLQKLRTSGHTRGVFTYDLYLTRAPREELLDEPLAHLQPVFPRNSDIGDSTPLPHGRAACPFAEPLRGRTYRAVLYATVIVGSSAAILYLDYDGGVMMAHGAKTQYWPLQNLVDCLVLFAIAPVAYLFVWLEKLMMTEQEAPVASSTGGGGSSNSSSVQYHDEQEQAWRAPHEKLPMIRDVTTYRDLLAEYDVAIGTRPDMQRIMDRVYTDYRRVVPASSSDQTGTLGVLARTVGVFVSGPEPLKRATEHAVAAIDASCFDIHDEEFEL